MSTSFPPSEVAEVLHVHPGLSLRSPGDLEGVLQIDHAFGEIALRDKFSVQISTIPQSHAPVLKEVGGRTAAIAKKYELADTKDLHCNPEDGTACVCVLQEMTTRFSVGSRLIAYIDELAVPYLYGLSYFDKFGKWPWAEYSHGALGLLEYYAKAPEQAKESYERVLQTLRSYTDFWPQFRNKLRNPGGRRLCICGSGQPFAKCHAEAWKGIRRMRTGLLRLGLDLEHLTK